MTLKTAHGAAKFNRTLEYMAQNTVYAMAYQMHRAVKDKVIDELVSTYAREEPETSDSDSEESDQPNCGELISLANRITEFSMIDRTDSDARYNNLEAQIVLDFRYRVVWRVYEHYYDQLSERNTFDLAVSTSTQTDLTETQGIDLRSLEIVAWHVLMETKSQPFTSRSYYEGDPSDMADRINEVFHRSSRDRPKSWLTTEETH